MQKIRLGILSLITTIGTISAANAIAPAAVAAIAAAVAAAGFSVYRSFNPTDTAAAFEFFSSCWTCGVFSGVTAALSDAAARIYSSLGGFVAVLALILTPLVIAWKVLRGYIIGEAELNAWKLGGGMGLHVVKLAFVSMLLLFPLPHLISRVAVEPVMNISMSFQSVLSETNAASNTSFDACLIHSIAFDNPESNVGIFSTAFKHKMKCSIAGMHTLTATGMTAGWLLFNSAFDSTYMYKIPAIDFPIFPNIGFLLLGLLLLIVYFWIIIPIALAFLEFVIKFTIDMIFLPLMLLGWLFKGNQLWEVKDEDMMSIINDIIKVAIGLGMIVIFLAFAMMLTGYALSGNAMIQLGEMFIANDPSAILNPDSMINESTMNLMFVGIFLAMFITMMTELVKKIVNDASLPDELMKQVVANTTKFIETLKKFGKKPGGAAAPTAGTGTP